MRDLEHLEPQYEGSLPEGAGIVLAILGGMAILPLIVAAVICGKPLWMVLAIWALGGPAVTVALGLVLVAPRQRDSDAGTARGRQDGDLRHV